MTVQEGDAGAEDWGSCSVLAAVLCVLLLSSQGSFRGQEGTRSEGSGSVLLVSMAGWWVVA